MSKRRRRGLIDSLMDAVWSAVDSGKEIKEKIEASQDESAERRRRRTLKRREAREGGDAAGSQIVIPPQAEEVAPEPKPGVGKKLTAFRKKLLARAKPRPKAPKRYDCPSCGQPNDPPVLFCTRCHESFFGVSRLLVLFLVTMAFGAFFGAEYFKGDLEWPWPIYVFFALVFVIVNAVLTRKATRLGLTALMWGTVFMAGGLVVFYLGIEQARRELKTAIGTFADFLEENPIALAVFLGGAALIGLILLLAMSRRYTLTHAYRILMLAGAGACYGAVWVYGRSPEFARLIDSPWFFDKGDGLKLAGTAALNLLRVLAAEIVVYSLVLSYRPAMETYQKKKLKPKPAKAGKGHNPMDQSVEMAYGLSLALGNAVTRFYLQIEHAFYTVARTLRDFARHLMSFLWVIVRDLVLPVLSLAGASAAVYVLSRALGDYIAEREIMAALRAMGGIAALFAAQFVFLCSKGRLPVRRLMGSQFLLMIWFSPYLLTLFIFLSVSLWGVALAARRLDDKLELAFAIGPATLLALGLTAAFFIFAVIKRQREGEQEGESPEPES